jgi:hypothetical protein
LYDAESDVVVCCIRTLLPPVLGETKAPAVEARRERSRHFILLLLMQYDAVFVMVGTSWSMVDGDGDDGR